MKQGCDIKTGRSEKFVRINVFVDGVRCSQGTGADDHAARAASDKDIGVRMTAKDIA